ncbi:MAG: glycosyl transferase [Mediterranea sp.]|jgi:hypothetical protein|nr:glycosyl transferase [Mediterranea sp.]
MNCLTFIPVGGLGNRMRAIASAVTLAQATRSELRIVWFRDWAMQAPFQALFQPLSQASVELREATRADHLMLDRPRPKNLFLPRLYQKCRFRASLYERSITPLCKEGFDFAAWVKQHERVYLASYTHFQNYAHTEIARLFVPQVELLRQIDERSASFATTRTIGVHIRRTDNVLATAQSPLELFYPKLDAEINAGGRTLFYLATDSEEVKQALKQRYGAERLMTSAHQADRTSLAGVQEGLVELYTLARTQKIFGSYGSSFSEIAAQVGQVPLEVVKW